MIKRSRRSNEDAPDLDGECEFPPYDPVLRALGAAGAAADATVLAVTIAALYPLIQSMMSNASTAADTNRQAVITNANLAAASLPILTDSVKKLLAPAAPTERIVVRSVQRQPVAEPLAVS